MNDLLKELADSTSDKALGRAAVVVAHPDDEVIGIGGRLARFHQALFIELTDGAPRNLVDAAAAGFSTCADYARARRAELLSALAQGGIAPEQLCQLGFPDQEASLHLVEATRALVRILREFRPVFVLTHPYEGGHPDHDATAFAVHAACALLRQGGTDSPPLIEMASYHNGGGWMKTGEFLPVPETLAPVVASRLGRDEQELKARLLACFPTQRATLQYFSVEFERYRLAPSYDFTRPPQEGLLYYELFNCGMTGAKWRLLAAEAQAALGLTGLL